MVVATGVSAPNARVFISYKRNVDPDQLLAREIVASMGGAGYDVFIDQQPDGRSGVGPRDRDARSRIAISDRAPDPGVGAQRDGPRRGSKSRGTMRPRTALPSSFPFDSISTIPFPIRCQRVHREHHLRDVERFADTTSLLRELMSAMSSGPRKAPPAINRPVRRGGAGRRPAYAAPLPVPGGTLDLDDPWYLARESDATALTVVAQPAQTLTIEGPRQMGKSSLLMRR